MSRLRAALSRHTRIALDTSILIYHLEQHPRYGAAARDLFLWLERRGHNGCVSTLAMTKVLVGPYQAGLHTHARAAFALLATHPHLEWITPTLDIADSAARLRASYRLRTPDAIHLATALHAGASAFVTNDLALTRVTELDVLALEALL